MIPRKTFQELLRSKLKCRDPSMIPLAAKVKEWLQKSMPVIDKQHTDLAY